MPPWLSVFLAILLEGRNGYRGNRKPYILTQFYLYKHDDVTVPIDLAGLLTLETRQMHRRQYEQYVCRRIPGRQAVAVMACENMHMSDDMILEPGLVMIFAHGVE